MKISVKRSVLDYTWLSMVAEIGGYVGLLLGVSLVDLALSLDGIEILWARLTEHKKSKNKSKTSELLKCNNFTPDLIFHFPK